MWQILNIIDPLKKSKKLPHFIVLKRKKKEKGWILILVIRYNEIYVVLIKILL